MSAAIKILIVGGYGVFGGRIVELLEEESRLILVVAGRSLKKARAYCDGRKTAKAQIVPAAFDRNGDIETQLAALRPDILIDASGPFQAYGDQPYRVIEACIALGVNYLDLADGSDFVAGVSAFDGAARAADRYVLTGVSSFPVLTAAVVRFLSPRMARIDSIRGGIAPSPFAGVGENVIRAIAGYAGQSIPLRRDGKAALGHPFTEHVWFTVAPPGGLPLQPTLFSLVDVPDNRVLAELWPQAGSVWMGAGPVPELLHRALIGLAWLVRWRLLPSLSPFTRIFHFVMNHLRWGEHRGGMFVAIAGADEQGRPIRRSWHLLAEGDDGPLIPAMAVQAVIRRVLDGRLPSSGARAAARDLEVDDYEKLFVGRAIRAGIREDEPAGASLYGHLLGAAWNGLPGEIRSLHDINGVSWASGRASVDRGRGLLARLAATIFRFPPEAADTPVRARFEVSGQVETWTRKFGEKSFSSRQFAGQGRSEGLLCERFGPLVFAMALVCNRAQMTLHLRRWSAFGIPLPMWLCPRAKAYETAADGRFQFHVEISHPLIGLIIRYKGWLMPESGSKR